MTLIAGSLRRIVLSTLVIAGAFALSAALAELVVRIFYPHTRDHVLPNGLIAMDPVLGWRLSPGAAGRHVTRYFDVTYTINDRGYRDAPRNLDKPPGVRRRVLAFGDSHLFGWGVAAGQRFTDLLQAAAPDLEVWNLGVPGYGLDQEFLSYKRDLANVAADHVLFYLSASTAKRVHSNYLYSKYKPQFTLVNRRLELSFTPGHRASVLSTAYGILGVFYLPYFVQSTLEILSARGSRNGNCAGCLGDLEASILLEAARTAQSRGHTMAVIVQSSPEATPGILRECGNLGIRCLPIEVDNAPGTRFGPQDLHFTPIGHASIAAQIRSQLPL